MSPNERATQVAVRVAVAVKDDGEADALNDGEAGTLYVVATPIGNLGDLSERAAEILRRVPVVAAEDSRRAARLLQHVGSSASIQLYHDHSSPNQRSRLLQQLQQGRELALVSDAGTPLISDPGYRLLRQALDAGISVVPIPGASAVTAALSVAGLATDSFVFEGFPPAHGQRRQQWLQRLCTEPRTLVLFESARRLPGLIDALCGLFGAERQLALAMELTKLHERVWRGTLGDLRAAFQTGDEGADGAPVLKGEAVLLLAGAPQAVSEVGQRVSVDTQELLQAFLQVCPPTEAARRVATLTGLSRRELYRVATQVQKG